MILSDCPIDSTQLPGFYSKKLTETGISFFSTEVLANFEFPYDLDGRKLLVPAQNTATGRVVKQWLENKSINMSVLGEFDDLALLQAFSQEHDDLIYISPESYPYVHDFCETYCVLGDIDELKEE